MRASPATRRRPLQPAVAGSAAIVARSVAAELSKRLGQRLYVDNKPGGAGNTSMGEVARADDQHTLIPGYTGALAVNPFSFDKLPCDPSKDFKPISLRAEVLRLNVAQPDLLSAACAKAVHEPASVERLMADEALPVGGMAAEFAQVKPDGRAEPSTATPRSSAAPAATQSPQAAMLAR